MASIAQKQLFVWTDVENLGDLKRLKLVLDYLPDEALVTELEQQRAKGRDRYPVRAMWNSLLAGIVYEHISLESLRRELLRNAGLREVCGFDTLSGTEAVPTAWAYSRFLKKLTKNYALLEQLFKQLVTELKKVLPDLGKVLAFDGKAIPSYATGKKKDVLKPIDGRGDGDAKWGVKTYKGTRTDGSMWETVKSWFGYRLHLIVDANYELPLAYELTTASENEGVVIDRVFKNLRQEHTELLSKSEYAVGDKGYDESKRIAGLWDEYGIKAVIDIRNCWKEGEKTKVITGYWNAVYDYKGEVFCVCPKTGKQRSMAYGGFEKDRQSLKYRCPALHYGIECKGQASCPLGKTIRIPLIENRRIFTPLPRCSYKWKKIYKMRSAVERVNSRLDVSFGFERHFIRGLRKMKTRCNLALCVMLALALGRIKENQQEALRSLVRAV